MVRFGPGAFTDEPVNANRAIELREYRIDVGAAAEHRALARDDRGQALPIARYQRGCHIARANVFRKRPLDLQRQVGGRRYLQNSSPCEGPTMHISIGIDSRKFTREAYPATLRAAAFCSSVAGTSPR